MPPLHRAGADLQIAVTLRKRLAQLVKRLAQIVPGLILGQVGPELEGKIMARLGSITVQQKVSQNGLKPGSTETGHYLLAINQTKIA